MYMDPTSPQEEYQRTEHQERPQIGLFRFWTETRIDLKTGETKDIDFVEWTRVGDRYEPKTIEKVARLKGNPAKGRKPMPEWAVVEPHYDGYKMGKERTEDGTAFDEWKGVDSQLVQVLEDLKIYTIEAFVAVPSHQVSGIKHPNVSRWHELAKEFLSKRANSEELQAELAKRDEQLADTQRQLTEMQAMLAEMTKPEPEPEEPTKRKPGRPRKAETEAATEAA